MRTLFLTTLFSIFAQISFAQLPDYTAPIPLSQADDSVQPQVNANRVLFFNHPVSPNSRQNFRVVPSVIRFDGNEVKAMDVVGAPGKLPAVRNNVNTVRKLLADPVGLCHENWLLNLSCPAEVLEDTALNNLSYNQLLADIRNKDASEEILFPETTGLEPYDKYQLGSLQANLADLNLDENLPEVICYDIVAADDWIACPVFGKVYIRLPKYGDRLPNIEDPILQRELGRELIELQSPIIVYRRGKDDNQYHLAGYLSNPSLLDVLLFDRNNPDPHVRFGSHHFPLAIAAGNFSDQTLSKNQSDISVMGTATLPHFFCDLFKRAFETNRRGELPHGLDCTIGLTWVRVLNDFSQPVQQVFDSLDLLVGGPAIYDMAAGKDLLKNNLKTVLFAPSNLPTKEGKFCVYKYYEEGMDPITHNLMPQMPQIIPPRCIEAKPPKGVSSLGPYRIATDDINDDGLADFAITWKRNKNGFVDSDHNLMGSIYSPWISVFKSDFQGTKIEYKQFDIVIPGNDMIEAISKIQLSSVAFGKYKNQKFLIAGNQKRNESEEGTHSSVFQFPILPSGVVDNLNVKEIRSSFVDQKGPGIADIDVDAEGNIVALNRAPFIRKMEGCSRDAGEVYGILWTMSFPGTVGGYGFLDIDGDGIPNRCECLDKGLPNENNDDDFDELLKDPSCDTCPGKFNIGDFEKNAQGRVVGDNVDDACDNCPASRCRGDIPSNLCVNPPDENGRQADSDSDGVGDSCDNCFKMANPQQGKVYLFVDNVGKPEYCVPCPNAYFLPNGSFHTVVPYDEYFDKVCAQSEFHGNDADDDGIFDVRDNCLYVSNPDQLDSDQDQSGDACDCRIGQGSLNAGPEDNCDNDSVPNRFDRSPFSPSVSQQFRNSQEYYAHLDTVYDPQVGYIADMRDLVTAGTDFRLIPQGQSGTVWEFLDEIFRWMQGEELAQGSAPPSLPIPFGQPPISGPEQPERVCGMSSWEYPGPVPCDAMGNAPRELVVLLPKEVTTGGGSEPGGGDGGAPIGTSSGSIGSRCIVKVGRGGPKTVAVFETEQKRLQELNNKVRDITGIADYDLFVGSEAGIAHFECLFDGGAAVGVSKASNVLPDVSGNVAPFGVWQTQGLPPVDLGTRPSAEKAIQTDQAFRLAPQIASDSASDAGKALSLMPDAKSDLKSEKKSENRATLPTPDIGFVMPDVREEVFPKGEVQAGGLAFNVNGKALVKVLTSENVEGSGVEMRPNAYQSVIAMDWKAFAEPYFKDKPVERRAYNVNAVLDELRRRVAERKEKDLPVTIEIFHDLPWETSMRSEFVVAQNTVPEAVERMKAMAKSQSVSAMQAVPSSGAVNQAKMQVLVAPASLGIEGGGCGCRFSADVNEMTALLEWALFILIFSFCVALRTVWIKKQTKTASSIRSGIV